MGRTAKITRDGLLNVAEEIVRSRGGAALTIGALAQAAGVSTGGVQGLRVSSDFAAASPQHRGWHRQSANLIMAMFGYNHHLLCRRPATIN